MPPRIDREEAKTLDDKRKEEVAERVEWWMNDEAYKPPEQLDPWYYVCMAKDIQEVARVGLENLTMKWSGSRLDYSEVLMAQLSS